MTVSGVVGVILTGTKEETYPCIKAISVNRVFTSIMNIIKTYKAK